MTDYSIELYFGAIVIALLSILLYGFVKKKSTIVITMGILVAGSILLVNLLQYSSFEKYSSKYINEDTIIKNLVIFHFYDNNGNYDSWRKSTTIEDENVIRQIVDDLSTISFKENTPRPSELTGFELVFLVSNKPKDRKVHVTESFIIEVSEDYFNRKKITKSENHLKTLESLVENENIEWHMSDVFYNYDRFK